MSQTHSAPKQLALVVNGEARDVAEGGTLAQLIEELGLAGQRVAVAINRDVVPRSAYARRVLAEGDRIEILRAVGGG